HLSAARAACSNEQNQGGRSKHELGAANGARGKGNTHRSRDKRFHVPSRLAQSPVRKWHIAPVRHDRPMPNPNGPLGLLRGSCRQRFGRSVARESEKSSWFR